jgi:hypothetical protein
MKSSQKQLGWGISLAIVVSCAFTIGHEALRQAIAAQPVPAQMSAQPDEETLADAYV